MINWRFPSNDYGENKGINDSGVATFRGKPLVSLAREICQNSLDAATTSPVTVAFNVFSIPTDDILGIDELRNAFKKCKEFWSVQQNGQTAEFFDNAIKYSKKLSCPILRISDFNTTGLLGSRESINTDWTNLTKSTGASDKKGSAGGSYGIGKYAPFACSNFSTVFYSTKDINDESAYQGVARLVTFKREDGMNTQGIGYYGCERNTPVYKEYNMDPSFVRKCTEYGTDIYVLSYKYHGEKWQNKIIPELLNSFLGAFWNELLEVKVGEELINKKNLPDIFHKYNDDIDNKVKKYYEVLISEKTHWFEEDYMGKNSLKLGILFGESDLPNKIAMIRKNGMKIMDKDRLPGHIPFVGVLFINGEDINTFLRSLENPQHTKWEIDRVEDSKNAKKVLSELDQLIKSKLNSLIDKFGEDETDASGIGIYLPDDDNEVSQEILKEIISDKIHEIELVSITKTTTYTSENPPKEFEYNPNGDDLDDLNNGSGELVPGDGDKEEWFHTNGTTYNPGGRPPQSAKEKGEGKEYKFKQMGVEKITSICVDKKKGRYLLTITPSFDSDDGALKVYLSGETNKFDVNINTAIVNRSKLNVNQNMIYNMKFEKGCKTQIAIEIDYNKLCSLEVEAYANQK